MFVRRFGIQLVTGMLTAVYSELTRLGITMLPTRPANRSVHLGASGMQITSKLRRFAEQHAPVSRTTYSFSCSGTIRDCIHVTLHACNRLEPVCRESTCSREDSRINVVVFIVYSRLVQRLSLLHSPGGEGYSPQFRIGV